MVLEFDLTWKVVEFAEKQVLLNIKILHETKLDARQAPEAVSLCKDSPVSVLYFLINVSVTWTGHNYVIDDNDKDWP